MRDVASVQCALSLVGAAALLLLALACGVSAQGTGTACASKTFAFQGADLTFDHCVVIDAGTDGSGTADPNPYTVLWSFVNLDGPTDTDPSAVPSVSMAVRKPITYPASSSTQRYVGDLFWLALAFTHGGDAPLIGSSAVVGFSSPDNRAWTVQNLYAGDRSSAMMTRVNTLQLSERKVDNDDALHITTLYFTRPLAPPPANPAPVPHILLDGTDTMVALAWGRWDTDLKKPGSEQGNTFGALNLQTGNWTARATRPAQSHQAGVANAWLRAQTLTAPVPQNDTRFGAATTLSADACHAFVASAGGSATNTTTAAVLQTVHAYVRADATAFEWHEATSAPLVVDTPTDIRAVASNADGSHVAVTTASATHLFRAANGSYERLPTPLPSGVLPHAVLLTDPEAMAWFTANGWLLHVADNTTLHAYRYSDATGNYSLAHTLSVTGGRAVHNVAVDTEENGDASAGGGSGSGDSAVTHVALLLSGSVLQFWSFNATNLWLATELPAPAAGASEGVFGLTMSLSYPRLAVRNSTNDSPRVVVYEDRAANPDAGADWALATTIVEPYLPYIPDHEFCDAMAFSARGTLLACGVPGDSDAGTVYLYALRNGTGGGGGGVSYVRADPPKPYNVNGLVRQAYGAGVWLVAHTTNATLYAPLNATLLVYAPDSGVGCVQSPVLYTWRSYNSNNESVAFGNDTENTFVGCPKWTEVYQPSRTPSYTTAGTMLGAIVGTFCAVFVLTAVCVGRVWAHQKARVNFWCAGALWCTGFALAWGMIQGLSYPVWKAWAFPDFKQSVCTVRERWPTTDLHLTDGCSKAPLLVSFPVDGGADAYQVVNPQHPRPSSDSSVCYQSYRCYITRGTEIAMSLSASGERVLQQQDNLERGTPGSAPASASASQYSRTSARNAPYYYGGYYGPYYYYPYGAGYGPYYAGYWLDYSDNPGGVYSPVYGWYGGYDGYYGGYYRDELVYVDGYGYGASYYSGGYGYFGNSDYYDNGYYPGSGGGDYVYGDYAGSAYGSGGSGGYYFDGSSGGSDSGGGWSSGGGGSFDSGGGWGGDSGGYDDGGSGGWSGGDSGGWSGGDSGGWSGGDDSGGWSGGGDSGGWSGGDSGGWSGGSSGGGSIVQSPRGRRRGGGATKVLAKAQRAAQAPRTAAALRAQRLRVAGRALRNPNASEQQRRAWLRRERGRFFSGRNGANKKGGRRRHRTAAPRGRRQVGVQSRAGANTSPATGSGSGSGSSDARGGGAGRRSSFLALAYQFRTRPDTAFDPVVGSTYDCWYDPANVHRVQFCEFERAPMSDPNYRHKTNVGLGVGLGLGLPMMLWLYLRLAFCAKPRP